MRDEVLVEWHRPLCASRSLLARSLVIGLRSVPPSLHILHHGVHRSSRAARAVLAKWYKQHWEKVSLHWPSGSHQNTDEMLATLETKERSTLSLLTCAG